MYIDLLISQIWSSDLRIWQIWKGENMLKAKFYCDIFGEDGKLLEENYVFDKGTFKDRQALDQYCEREGYVPGDDCGHWGDDVGIFKDLLVF